jgi:Cytochrome c oxidase caa3 assembly factor (Caa3_CtaG)
MVPTAGGECCVVSSNSRLYKGLGSPACWFPQADFRVEAHRISCGHVWNMDRYWFSRTMFDDVSLTVHMVQHVLLMSVSPPLILLAWPIGLFHSSIAYRWTLLRLTDAPLEPAAWGRWGLVPQRQG